MRISAKPNSALQRWIEAVSSLKSCGSALALFEEDEVDTKNLKIRKNSQVSKLKR